MEIRDRQLSEIAGMEEDCVGSQGPQWTTVLEEEERKNKKKEEKKMYSVKPICQNSALETEKFPLCPCT
jgi:hypothetical protein